MSFVFLECETLIRRMLVVKPKQRLTVPQILSHSWIQSDGYVQPEPGGSSRENFQPTQLNQTVIETMLKLPGLSKETLLDSVQRNDFDHVSAIYNLLVDELENASNVPSIQMIPDYMPVDTHQLEKVR